MEHEKIKSDYYAQFVDPVTYVDPYRVEVNLFVESEIPEYHPLSLDYREYWREIRRRCIEGYWQSGVWCPGTLYSYVNLAHIKRNVKGAKVKQFALPLLRDVEWMVFYNAVEARGFSGFRGDPIYSCHEALTLDLTDHQIENLYCYREGEWHQESYDNIFKKDKTRKIYQAPRLYLRKVHNDNYGVPLFLNMSQNMLTFGSREFGKATAKETTVIHREDGKVLLKDLKVGDKIYDDSGNLTTVEKIWEQGKLPLYRVTLSDGRYVDACAEHLWEVIERSESKVLNTSQLIEDYIIERKKTSKIKSSREYRYFIKHNKPVNYPEKQLPIDPYTLGLLIGDGSLTQNISFTTADKEIINYIPYQTVKYKQKYTYGVNGIKKQIEELNLNCKSECKFIPEIYKTASINQRLELLKGLMDTDGSVHGKRQVVEFSTSSEQLCKDVVELVRSLGLYCNWSKRKTKCLDNFRVFITPNQQIFKLKRKAEALTNFDKPRASKSAIVNIELLEGIHDAACIQVSNESKLFLVNDFIVTHNSYIAAWLTMHEWLFDGLTEYIPASQVKTSADIIMGASDAKYSGETLGKAKIYLDMLPGTYETYDTKYPSPLSKKYKGSWGPSKDIIAEYKKKVKGNWEDVGTKSIIRHRTFKDNPYAGQGSRNSLIIAEEIGAWGNFLECFSAMVDNQQDGSFKFGSMFMWGTGGMMEEGVAAAMDIFYDPDKYNCITFEDIWEQKGQICFFMPAYLSLNDTKDRAGKTDLAKALAAIHDKREKLRSDKGSKERLQKEMQYRPIKPSEMFLTKTGNFFPIVELKNRLTLLEATVKPEVWAKKVRLVFDNKSSFGVSYEIDTQGELTPIDRHPWRGSSKEGCVVLYELPVYDRNGVVPEGLYIIGHDPVATDSVTGESYACTWVMKTKKYWQHFGHDELVAVHVSRPYEGRSTINENLLKLSMLYGNAKVYFENAVGNVKEYFEKMKRLDLLARQPTTVFNKKASFDGRGAAVIYGYPMSNRKIKLDAVQYVRDWLLEERGTDEQGNIVRNLDRIWDKALLQELIAYDLDGNFDRVSALMGCVIGLNETHNQYESSIRSAARELSNVNSLKILMSNKLVGLWDEQDLVPSAKEKAKSISLDLLKYK